MKAKKILAIVTAALTACFSAALTGCSDDVNVTFNVAESYSAEQGTIFSFPAVSAEADGQNYAVEIAVEDASGAAVQLYNNSFFVESAEDYTATFSAFGKNTERTISVTASDKPELWVQCSGNIPVQSGRPYRFDTDKIKVTENTEITFALTSSDGSPVVSEQTENGIEFTPQAGKKYTLEITAEKGSAQVSESITFSGVDRSDNVIATFEEEEDFGYVVSDETFPVDISLSQNYAHSGSYSVRMNNLSGGNFPRMKVRPGGNINVDPDTTYTVAFWFYLENPDNEPVGLNVATVDGNRYPDLYVTGTVPTGKWTYAEYDVKGSQVYDFGIYMFNWDAASDSGLAPSSSISLYIDDIYLHPQIEGKSVYWVKQETGAFFDLAADLEGQLSLGGHTVVNNGEYRVTRDTGNGEEEVTLTDGKIPCAEEAVWRIYPQDITGEIAYVVRVKAGLSDEEVPYADCTIEEDAQQFDLGGAFVYREGLGLFRSWDVGLNPFTLTFLAETEFDLANGGRVLFDMNNDATGQPYTVTVTVTLADGTEMRVFDIDGMGNTFDLDMKQKTLYFDLPAGGTLVGAKLSFTFGPDHYGNIYLNNFRVTAIS